LNAYWLSVVTQPSSAEMDACFIRNSDILTICFIPRLSVNTIINDCKSRGIGACQGEKLLGEVRLNGN